MRNVTQTARTLLMVSVMIAAALMPMVPEATELRDEAKAMRASISTDVANLTIDEGGWEEWYSVTLDEAPDGVLVITPSSDAAGISLDPSYLKFTKANWDMTQWVYVSAASDDDGNDTVATITHAISGDDTVFSTSTAGDIAVTAYDMDVDSDVDGLHDGIDDDDDGDGVLDADEEPGCQLSTDCDGDNTTDDLDAFDNDDTEDTDTDGDGTGDNSDAFPSDATEYTDTDGDGTGDNADAFPSDATEDTDTDGDGTGDNADAFDNDSTEDTDTDGDGVGNNTDAFPEDSTETVDLDGDGIGDNADTDDDNDTVLDADEIVFVTNATGLGPGIADGNETVGNVSYDCSRLVDCDGDGVTDDLDAFDDDPEAWDDTDGDGLADTFPNLLVESYGQYGCDMPDSPSSWNTHTCTFVLPDEGLDLVLELSYDSWFSEAGASLTHPDGTTETLALAGGNWGTDTFTYTAAAPGEWTFTVTDSWGDGGTAATATYGSYTPGEIVLIEFVVPTESGWGTSLDDDDDGDGFSDTDEGICGTDHLDNDSVPTDTDSDTLCDAGVDDDDDGDGVLDVDEADGSALDLDGDGTADGIDCTITIDCDGDGVGDFTDTHDADPSEQTDMDGDGVGDNGDSDMDGDGYLNEDDAFPSDGTDWADNDGDGVGDNADADDDTCPHADGTALADGTTATCGTFTGLGSQSYDFYPGDGVEDANDTFPLSPAETADNDGDGWGNNADYDDDNDGIGDPQDDDMDGDGYSNDDEETNCVGDGGDESSNLTTPADNDGDGDCDYLDTDDDDDGVLDSADAFPFDECASEDSDGDGSPNNITTGCVTDLILDLDNDYDPSNIVYTFHIWVDGDTWSTSEGSILVTDTDDDTVLISSAILSSSLYYVGSATAGNIQVCGLDSYGDGWGSSWSQGGVYVMDTDDLSTGYTIHANFLVTGAGTCVALSASDYVAGIWTDADEIECGTDPLDSSSTPLDLDGDNLCDDIQDDDNDGDGYNNTVESAAICGTDPMDATDVPVDTDTDGLCNFLDDDDDGDGINDTDESDGSALDLDGDGTADGLDCSLLTDCDGDGVDDGNEADGTGIGSAGADVDCALTSDCDGDGVNDSTDLFPADASETVDFDGDGIGDNGDTDDDGDGYSDADETTNCGDGTNTTAYSSSSDPMNASDTPDDMDGDLVCDYLDGDRDGDFLANDWDGCPDDPSGYTDTDGDGLCDESDSDDDNDTYNDTVDAFPLDAGEWSDLDGDGLGDNTDADIDGDGVDNQDDECELDDSGSTDTDGDGVCNISDSDDDGDGVLDTDEVDGCDLLADCDGDGVNDDTDAFITDPQATTDTDGDGLPDEILNVGTYWGNYTFHIGPGVAVFCGAVNALGQSQSGLCPEGWTGTFNYTESMVINRTLEQGGVITMNWYASSGGGLFDGVMADGSYVNMTHPDGTVETLFSPTETVWNLQNWITAVSDGGIYHDMDDDADGYTDAQESWLCVGDLSDPLDDTSTPTDTDSDNVCDYVDEDDDGDSYNDTHEGECGTDPLLAGDVPDNDFDGVCDPLDSDDDNDGVLDDDDWAPFDGNEWLDTDGDGTGDNEDNDADGDGVDDEEDAAPLDRCASMDTDGDGLVDSHIDCSTMGFSSVIDSNAGDNAGDGFSDDFFGITDDPFTFGGAIGDQWFAISDIDGVYHMTADHATGVAALSFYLGVSSSSTWDDEDYVALHWVGDDGTTTSLLDSRTDWEDWGGISAVAVGFWLPVMLEVPSEDGHLVLEASSDDDSEIIGLDDVAYLDRDQEVISVITFEDSVESMGMYSMPSTPTLAEGTYTILIDDSYGDGGHGIVATMNGAMLCDIGQYSYDSAANCTFTVTDFGGEALEVSVDTDSWPYEGTMTIIMPDGSSVVETWTSDTAFEYEHSGTAILPMAGNYSIVVSDSFGDGGHGVTATFNGEQVCDIGQYSYSSGAACNFVGTGYDDSVLEISLTTDGWPSEGSMIVTFPDGSTSGTLTWGSAGLSLTYENHSGEEVMPESGAIDLLNGWGATVALDVSGYNTAALDDDDDGDGFLDDEDAFPLDDEEWDDMDGDGIGSNADNDDDGDGINDGADDFHRHPHAHTDTDGDGMPDEIGWETGDLHEGFEAGNYTGLDDYSNGWSRSGDANFGMASGDAFDGYTARAGLIGDNESTTLEVEMYTESGWVSFEYSVSTEDRYDTLTFSVDGMEYFSVSGQDHDWEFVCDTPGSWTSVDHDSMTLYDGGIPGNWVNDGYADCGDTDGDGTSDDEGVNGWYTAIEGTHETWVDAGDHTFTWTYSKDATESGGNDRVYLDNIVFPYMMQGDGECTDGTEHCHIEDMDDDNDGILDLDDDCPTDAGENLDTDGDGFCDNADADDDGDGYFDYNDVFPLDGTEWADFDGDGLGDNADPDDDGDGCLDEDDDLPYDASDCDDLDGDGVGDATDPDDDGDNVMDDVDPFPEDGSAWADNDGDGDPDFTGDPPFLGNFEGGAIPAGWSTYGSAPWFACGTTVSCGTANGSAINGSYSAESGDISDSQTSSLEVTMMTLAGDVTFSYETSTESFWDYLRFYVDGSLAMSWSGVTAGTHTHTVAAGWHTFEWMYYKDGSVSSNADTVWVDDITMPVSQTLNQSDMDDDNDGIADEFDLDPYDPCVSADTDGDGSPDWVMSGTIDMSGLGLEEFIVDCDASMWMEDWDDDGDGWADELEMICGSDWLDGMDYPYDGDGDWICDAMDHDLDDDGYMNPLEDCSLLYEEGEDAVVDCIADGFRSVDADSDGDITYMELIHAFYFQNDWSEDEDDDWFEHSFFCGDGSEIPFEWVNDNISDCADGADEQQYDADGNPINWFDCSDGTTIWVYQVNDGMDDCPDGEDESWFYDDDDMDDGADDEVGTMSHDGTNDTHDDMDDDMDDSNGTDDDWDDEMVCYNMWTHTVNNDSESECSGYQWYENASFGEVENFTGCYNIVSHVVTTDDADSCVMYMWVSTSGGPGDGDGHDDGHDDGDDDGDGDDGGEPMAWPSAEDMALFEDLFWDYYIAWDNDSSGSFSFDEYWTIGVDEGDIPSELTNPGWSAGSTDWDQFPYDQAEWSDTDLDGIGDNTDNDDDGDGVPDSQDEFPLDGSESSDLDGDGIGDNSDDDIDGDGVDNSDDDFDSDPGAAADNDGDGLDDASDADDDNDGVPDVADWSPLDQDCIANPMGCEQYDTDGDGVGDNADTDDDTCPAAADATTGATCNEGYYPGDGVEDANDAFRLDPSETTDSDGDGIGDNADPDDDNDNVPDGLDAFDFDATESRDTDGDGVGDNADPDMDGDGYLNSDDAFPLNELEWIDTDGDNIGDNSDSDDDGDGVIDTDDFAPLDSKQWMDTDGDGMGDNDGADYPNGDTDDDNDGFSDAEEDDCGTDSKSAASQPSDFDGDGLCDAKDATDDRTEKLDGQEEPGFTPGFPSVLAAISLLGAAVLGRRKED